MDGYRLTVEGRDDISAVAATVGGIVDKARPVAIKLPGPELVTMTITDPAGRAYPFVYGFDPAISGLAGVVENVDDLLWDVRATLHYDADQRERAAARPSG